MDNMTNITGQTSEFDVNDVANMKVNLIFII